MGSEDKLLKPFRDKTIFETTLSAIHALNEVSAIYVVVQSYFARIGEFAKAYKKVILVENTAYPTGQTSSVKAGLLQMDEKHPFMVALSDMPNIRTAQYSEFIQYFQAKNQSKPSICRPINNDKIGNPVLFDFTFKSDLLENTDPHSSKNVIKKHKYSLHFWNTNESSFFQDIDTPEDYENLISSGW